MCAFPGSRCGLQGRNVTLEVFDKNKPANADELPVPLLVTVKFRGSGIGCGEAMEAAEEVAKQTRVSFVPTLSRIRQRIRKRC